MSTPVILALDIATRSTGWCVGSGDTVPALGAWQFPDVGEDYGALIDQFHECLVIAHKRFQFTHALYEAPILVIGHGQKGQHTDKLETIRKIYGMGLHFEWFCKRVVRVPCVEESAKKIKKRITGNPLATKDDMMFVARKVGFVLPSPGADDAADAWGGWICGLDEYTPKLAKTWDQRMWTGKGSLL